jgi:5-formyltetrahydrofolate cyclo-ligase
MDKSALRVQCRALRDAMTAETVASASASIHHHLAAWPIFQQAQTVMAYMAFGNEINLVSLMEQFRDKRWVVPRTLMKPKPHLVLHPYDPARLVRHCYGMLEPDASLPVIEPGALDLVFVPGVAFDRRGYRLGFGGGFYDRFLPHVTASKVGLVYAALIVEHVPNDEFDQPVEFLACEAGMCETMQPIHRATG